jgi:hypothetical protein
MSRMKKPGTFCAVACLILAAAGESAVPGAQAQTTGNNAISAGSSIVGSSAFIDASVFGNSKTKPTFCSIIRGILSGSSYPTYPAFGAVIDARGLNSGNSTLTCASGETPWEDGAGGYFANPSVLLLPASTITIHQSWVLPDSTKLVGEGASSSGGTGTVIAAASALSARVSPPPIIQFGDASTVTNFCSNNPAGAPGVCFRISVEDVTLNGSAVPANTTIDGILNLDSQELTYVRRVTLYNINGTGLHIGNSTNPSQAQNSGPYEQIYSYSSLSTGNCAWIYAVPTRGIHSITCTSSVSNPGGAILLDGASNTLEDVFISGFTDGILVGSQSSTTNTRPFNNTLFNINGGSSVKNLVHICLAGLHAGNCPTTSVNTAQDISILGLSSAGTNSIEDDVTGTTLTDPHVGMYALGDVMPSGNSRLTTSTVVPSWFIGKNPISGTPVCPSGSIYSNSGSGSTLWACVNDAWSELH